MADSAQVQHQKAAALDRNPFTERCDGAVVSDAFLDAVDLQQPARFQGMVLESI